MKCPIDNTDLVMTDRQGIEIDYCPQCRGVWLDRGELDKIIERTQVGSPPAAPQNPAWGQPYPNNIGYGEHGEGRSSEHGRGRKRGFLGELFD